MKKQTGDFASGSVLARIVQIAGPMTLALLINVLYNVVDRIYIGHMPGSGALALTGIGLSFPILMMISAFQSLCSSGGTPIFSLARGRGDREEASRALGNTYMMLLVLEIPRAGQTKRCRDGRGGMTGFKDVVFALAALGKAG